MKNPVPLKVVDVQNRLLGVLFVPAEIESALQGFGTYTFALGRLPVHTSYAYTLAPQAPVLATVLTGCLQRAFDEGCITVTLPMGVRIEQLENVPGMVFVPSFAAMQQKISGAAFSAGHG